MIRKPKTLGFAFGDSLRKVNKKTAHFHSQKEKSWEDLLIPNYKEQLPAVSENSWRPTIAVIIIIICFFGIFIRLFHLQVVRGDEMKKLADGNRVQIKVIHAPRGVIYDRNGKVLAANAPGFRLTNPESKKIRYISREEALELEVKKDPLAANLEVDSLRFYPGADKTAHILGYIGEISPEQLETEKYKNYKSGDVIGQSGIEYVYEEYLRGSDGGEIIEIDSKGKKIRTIREIPPVPGQNLYLSIDNDLQILTFNKLKEVADKSGSCCAAAIVQNPTTGEILADVSIPSFDSNIFTQSLSGDSVLEILTAENSPVLNRSIGGTYPPGSTYKIISSLAALDSGKVKPDTIFEDTGEIFLGPFRFTNWYFTQYGRKEGPVDLVKALKRSNDTYYYRVGELIGEEIIGEWSKKLGIGKTLGIDLPGEQTGLVPDGKWKQETLGEVWYPGDTLHMSIGQGFILTTPLQVLAFTSFIAADGVIYQPHLALKITGEGDQIIKEFEPKVLAENLATKEQIDIIKKGLEEVPKDGGTAWPFFTFPILTAGKTGTAEYGDAEKTHAWYTGYAPADDPKITATVLIEGGGEGSSVASPVVKEIFRWFLSDDKNKLIKDTGSIATDSARTLGE
jgi:penicillin-binding protein 2